MEMVGCGGHGMVVLGYREGFHDASAGKGGAVELG